MLRLTILLALCVYCVSAAQQAPSDNSLVHGTINVALGNKNGIVVLTDSMLTETRGGQQRQLPDNPAQKLFKLDDRTVAAFAGFYAAPARIEELYTNTSAIIHEYIRQSATTKPQTIAEKLRALASLFNTHLTAVANVRNASGDLTPNSQYEFQLIVAGYDLDGEPKVGRIVLKTGNQPNAVWSETNEQYVQEIDEKLLWKLNGIDYIAQQLLGRPDIQPSDTALREYATAVRKDFGRNLTVEQMTKLAERLEHYTSNCEPGVGGATQVAVLQKGHVVSVRQQTFPELPRPLVNFQVFVAYDLINNKMVGWPTYHGESFVCVRCYWSGAMEELDGFYLIGSSFNSSTVRYDGGPIDFGDTAVADTQLIIGRDAAPDSENVKHLVNDHKWKNVLYEKQRQSPPGVNRQH